MNLPPLQPDLPISFGYKCAWYAIQTGEMDAVASALGLRNVQESTWRVGIEKAYSGNVSHSGPVFITPPLGRWILAAGQALFYPGNSPKDFILPRLTRLSQQFGIAQYFCTHRVVEAHCWAAARNGELVRAYGYIGERGEVTWDFGERTPIEFALAEYWTTEDDFTTGPSENELMEVAAEWSVDPSNLESHFTTPSLGRLGELAG